MSAIDRFWISLGFTPHKSNSTHFWAGIPIGLLFFLLSYFHFELGFWLSTAITFGAGSIIASLKEWSDHSMRKDVAWKRWDWLDWIYTVAGSLSIPLIVGLAIVIL